MRLWEVEHSSARDRTLSVEAQRSTTLTLPCESVRKSSQYDGTLFTSWRSELFAENS